MRKIWDYLRTRQALANLLIVLCGIAFYMLLENFQVVRRLLSELFSMLSPLIIGAIIAYLLSPIVQFFENRVFGRMKHRKPAHMLSVIITLLLAFGILGLIVTAIIPQLAASVTTLLQNLDGYFEEFKTTLKALSAHVPMLHLDVDALVGTSGEALETCADWVLNNGEEILGGALRFSSSILDFLLAMVLSIYVLFDQKHVAASFRRWGKSIVKPEKHARVGQVIGRCHRIFMNYVGGNLLDALIIGVANFLFLIILGIPYPLLIAMIAAVTNLIPTFGPIIGGIPNFIIILIINPLNALWFLIFTVASQLLDGSLIKPLLFGDSTGLKPLWALAAIIIGGRLFGILGMLLGVPVFAIISTLMDDAIEKRLARKGLDHDGNPPATDAAGCASDDNPT